MYYTEIDSLMHKLHQKVALAEQIVRAIPLGLDPSVSLGDSNTVHVMCVLESDETRNLVKDWLKSLEPFPVIRRDESDWDVQYQGGLISFLHMNNGKQTYIVRKEDL